jgi:EpsI family protein
MNYKRTLIACALMLLTMVSVRYLTHARDVEPTKPFSSFPKKIGEWIGKEERFDQRIVDVLGVDDSILFDYRRPDGRQVQLYVGYYHSQREGALIHSPKNCMPGAGWNIVHTSLEKLSLTSYNPDHIQVIKLILQKGSQRQVVLYWFQSRGRFIHSEYWQKIYLVIDSITRSRTDGSFVRLISSVTKDEQTTLETLKSFAKQVIPILNNYIPS